MAGGRIPVEGVPRPKIVRPTASPVDTYVAPERNTDVEQLASGLAEIVPSLSRFAGVIGEQKGKQEREKGEAAAREMRDQGKSFTEAVKEGKIRPDQNPWFRVGFYETIGRNTGAEYVGSFLEAFGKSEASESVELADFDEFERKFREAWTTERLGADTDPFLANAFGTTADGQIAGIRNDFARQAGSRMVKLNTEAFHSEVFNLVQSFGELETTAEGRAAVIRLAQERQVATGGMNYAQVNKVTAEAIAAAAVRLRDTSVLDILDEIPTNKNSKGDLGGTSYGAALREQAETAITRAIDEDVRREEAVKKRERDKAIKTVSGGLVDTLMKDPGADITTFISTMRDVDPTYIPTLFAMRDTIASGSYADDPDVVRSLSIGIHTRAPGGSGYTTLRDLDVAFGARNLTIETYRTLRSDLEKRDEAGGSGRFLRNPILTDITTETRRTFISEYPDGLVTPAVRMNAQAAADEAEFQMLEWLQKNPEATPEQILTTKTSIRERVVRQRIGLQERIDNTSASTQGGASAGVKPAGFLLADPLLVGQLARELQALQAGELGKLSSVFAETFRINRIDPNDIKAVTDFLKEQQKWTTAASPKP